jgi:hypothetical protein
MSKVRGIRFNAKEDALVEEFLAANPLIDFTTLAKVSILEFIKKPQINLRAVGNSDRKEGRSVRSHS